uniref:Uncharacterized protein n=1 Tax=Arundo donax TaxID=35708 RepID=A0A0A9B1H0_ARUDO
MLYRQRPRPCLHQQSLDRAVQARWSTVAPQFGIPSTD